MLYAVPVLITSLCVSIEWSFAGAVLATVLTYMGYYVSPPGGHAEEGYVNRLIAAVLAIPAEVTPFRRQISANSGRIAILMRPIIRAILSGSAVSRLPSTMVSMDTSPTAPS